MTLDKTRDDVLGVPEIEAYLQSLREICHDTPIIDCHVHATEVIGDKVAYGSPQRGIFSAEGFDSYRKPSLGPVRLALGDVGSHSVRQNRLSEMAFTRAYRYTGATVLRDHMSLAGVDRAVLLPVANGRKSFARQMQIIDSCRDLGNCFVSGYSVDNSIPEDKVADHLRDAIRKHDIGVVKIHANVSGIDLTGQSGRNRISALLQACDRHGLPVLLHGGCSPILGDRPESKFSVIENLKEIDWRATRYPVIIAHFGVYGCDHSTDDISDKSVRQVQNILDSHSNVYLDTSGVMFPAVHRMLRVIDPSRLVFGSDAMYVPIYRQIALVMHALTTLGIDLDTMRTIASDNAMAIFNAPD